jgi:hypothetical protein
MGQVNSSVLVRPAQLTVKAAQLFSTNVDATSFAAHLDGKSSAQV